MKRVGRTAMTPPGVRILQVDRRESGLRLDLFLVGALPECSRKRAKRLVDQRKVSVDGRIEAMASRLIQKGQRVEVQLDEEVRERVPQLTSLFEDDFALAVDKPWGLPSGPTRDATRLHVERVANSQFACKLTLLHRLDKDTSGVLLFAKTPAFARSLADQFKHRRVDKVYLALVHGSLPMEREMVSHLREGDAGRMQVVRSGGMRAVTVLRRLAVAGDIALVEARPHTGRTHQIRVHLAQLGCPILGDALYGGLARLGDMPLQRQMLHAYSLAFEHPELDTRVEIRAPIPEDFLAAARVAFGSRLPPLLRDGGIG